MSFPRIRTSGGWVGVVFTAEFEAFDLNLSRAIDGFGGGAYAPSTLLTIGGAGVRIEGSFRVIPNAIFDGAFTAFGNCVIFGSLQLFDLDVDGTADFAGTVVFNDNVTMEDPVTVNDTLTVNGNIIGTTGQFTSGVTVAAGGAIINGNIAGQSMSLSTTLTVAGAATFTSGAWLVGASILSDVLNPLGAGRVPKRITSLTVDADQNLSIATTDIYYEASGTFTGTKTLTILDTGAVQGDMLMVRLNPSATTVAFRRQSGVSLGNWQSGMGQSLFIFIFHSGVWEQLARIDAGHNP